MKKAFQGFCAFMILAGGLFCASCNNNGNNNDGSSTPESSDITNTTDTKSPEFYGRMLEHFCQDHFDDLFEDIWGKREYFANTLTVDSVSYAGEREVNVFGELQFEGRAGKDRQCKFDANIYEKEKQSNEYIITFRKHSKKLISKKEYIESRTKTYHYEE